MFKTPERKSWAAGANDLLCSLTNVTHLALTKPEVPCLFYFM